MRGTQAQKIFLGLFLLLFGAVVTCLILIRSNETEISPNTTKHDSSHALSRPTNHLPILSQQEVERLPKNFQKLDPSKVYEHTSGEEYNRTSIAIYRTEFKYPLVRVETNRRYPAGADPEKTKVSQTIMVANQLLVRRTPKTSDNDFRLWLQNLGFEVNPLSNTEDVYRVHWKFEGVDQLGDIIDQLTQNDGYVQYAEPDYLAFSLALTGESTAQNGQLWGLNNTGQQGGTADADIHAEEAWDIRTNSESVVVAVLDTGVHYGHSDLSANMWVNPGEIPANGIDDDENGFIDDVHGINPHAGNGDPDDDNGHGTHCAGIIAADGTNGQGVVGVCWQSQVMGLKFLSSIGAGTLSDAITCIDYAIHHEVDIINASWGTSGYSQSLFEAFQRAGQAGILVVAASGNDGKNNDNEAVYPSGFLLENIIAVGASDRNDAISNFTNYGETTVHLTAPGVDILSCGIGSPNATTTLSGSSMAAAFVSGAATLLRAEFPDDSHLNTMNRLINGADYQVTFNGNFITEGRLNLHSSLVRAHPRPLNDDFTTELNSSKHALLWFGHTIGSTREASEPGDSESDGSVWYRWTSPESGNVALTLDGNFPSVVRVYTGNTLSNLEEVAYSGNGATAFPVAAGHTYYFQVHGLFGQHGRFSLQLSIPPGNDLQANAQALSGIDIQTQGSNLGATKEQDESTHAGNPGGRSVWWRWTAPLTGPVQFSTAGSDFDTLLAAYAAEGSSSILQGANPEIILVIDVSGSTTRTFEGGYVDDTNNDGKLNTVLDGQVAACISLIQSLIDSGKGDSSQVSIVSFSSSGTALDVGPISPGIQLQATPNSDENNNGQPDLIEALKSLRSHGGTDFEAALSQALAVVNSLSPPAGEANVIFFSDGWPNDLTSYTDEVNQLEGSGVLLRAFGAGASASLEALLIIDPNAAVFTEAADFTSFFSGAVASNDDFNGQSTSEITFNARAGAEYLIAVDGYEGASGTISLSGRLSRGLEILSPPQAVTLNPREDHIFTVSVRGIQPLYYQWYFNDEPIPGAEFRTLTVENASLSDQGQYHVVAGNAFGSVASEKAFLSISIEPPAITRQPADANIVQGSVGKLQVEVDGTEPIQFQWYFKGNPISGATNPSYTIPAVDSSDVGYYHVVATNEVASVTSQDAYIQVSDSSLESWILRQPSHTASSIHDLVFVNDRFFAIGYRGKISVSNDGLNWQEGSVPDSYGISLGDDTGAVTINTLDYLNGTYVAFGIREGADSSVRYVFYTSADGHMWNLQPNPHQLRKMSFIDGVYVAYGRDEEFRPSIFYSSDLENWNLAGTFGMDVLAQIVSKGDVWKYWDNGHPGGSYPDYWYTMNYDDSAWPEGSTPIGYGEPDIVTTVSDKQNTVFLRHPIAYDGGGSYIKCFAKIRADDGFRLYINNNEVHRENLPSYFQWYDSAVEDITAPEETEYKEFTFSTYFSTGSVIGVDLHQHSSNPDSRSDLGFDMEAHLERIYHFFGPIYGNGRTVIVRTDGVSFTSTDGINWNEHRTNGLADADSSDFAAFPNDGVIFLNGQFMAWDNSLYRLYTSTDGANWTVHTTNRRISNLSWDGNVYFQEGSRGRVYFSHDAITWSETSWDSSLELPHASAYGKGLLVGVNSFGQSHVTQSVFDWDVELAWEHGDFKRLRVLNGTLFAICDWFYESQISWDAQTWYDFGGVMNDVCYDEKRNNYCVPGAPTYRASDVEEGSRYYVEWQEHPHEWDLTWEPTSFVCEEGVYVATGDRGGIATSTDGLDWTEIAYEDEWYFPYRTNWVEYAKGYFFILRDSGEFQISQDGVQWETVQLDTDFTLKGVAYGNGRFVICADGTDSSEFFFHSEIELTPPTEAWTKITIPGNPGASGIAFGDGQFVAVAEHKILASPDGQEWAMSELPGVVGLDIAWFKGTFVVSGLEATILQAGTIEVVRPEVTVSGVEEDSEYTIHDPIQVTVNALDSDGTIDRIEVYLNDFIVAETTASSLDWEHHLQIPGDYRLSIAVYDDEGNAAYSHRNFTVTTSNWQINYPQLPASYWMIERSEHYGLIALGPDGLIANSHDGLDWKIHETGTESYVRQLCESDDGVIVATTDDGEVLWSDNGLRWILIPAGLDGDLLTCGNGRFLYFKNDTYGAPSYYYSSVDGIEWERHDFETDIFGSQLNQVSFARGNFFITTRHDSTYTSADGINWSRCTNDFGYTYSSYIVHGSEQSVLVANGDIYSSQDGASWTLLPRPIDSEGVSKLSYQNGIYVLIKSGGVWTSPDMQSWSGPYSSPEGYLISIDGLWIDYNSGSLGHYKYSPDLINWTTILGSVIGDDFTAIAASADRIIAVGGDGFMVHSTDGKNWIFEERSTVPEIKGLAYHDNLWVGVNLNGEIYTSTDGLTWTQQISNNTEELEGVIYKDGVWLAYGGKIVLRSTNGTDWSPTLSPDWTSYHSRLGSPAFIALDHFVFTDSEDNIYSSPDGQSWQINNDNSLYIMNVIADDGTYAYAMRPERYVGAGHTYYRSTDLIDWTYFDVPWPNVFPVTAEAGNTQYSKVPNHQYFRADEDESWFEVETNWGFVNVAGFKGSYYGISYDLRIFEFSLADLAPQNVVVSAPLTAASGDSFQVSFDIRNLGHIEYGQAIPMGIDIILSSDERIGDFEDPVIQSFTWNDTIPIGDKKSLVLNLSLPDGLVGGTYYVGVQIDTTNLTKELNEENNTILSLGPVINIPVWTLNVTPSEGGVVRSGSEALVASSEAGSLNTVQTLSATNFLANGSRLELVPTPNKGYTFAGWQEYPTLGQSPLILTMNQNHTVTPVFERAVRLRTQVTGNGKIKLSPDEGTYQPGTEVTLTALPNPGWAFDHWIGVTGAQETASLTLDDDLSVTAVFSFTGESPVDYKSGFFSAQELANSSISGDHTDNDGDGYTVFEEFVYSMDPRKRDAPKNQHTVITNNMFRHRFSTNAKANGVHYRCETSTDLKTWTALEGELDTVFENSSVKIHELSWNISDTRRFFRVIPEQVFANYTKFQESHIPEGGATSGKNGNNDGDAFSNFEEYLLNLDPNQPDASPNHSLRFENGKAHYQLEVNGGASDGEVVIQSSSDLQNWNSVGLTVSEISSNPKRKILEGQLDLSTSPRGFFRIITNENE